MPLFKLNELESGRHIPDTYHAHLPNTLNGCDHQQTMAEFRSAVKNKKSNTKILRNRFQFIVTNRVYIFGKCLCLAFSSLWRIWKPELLRITKKKKKKKKKKNSRTLLKPCLDDILSSAVSNLRGDYHNPLPAKLVQTRKINLRRVVICWKTRW